MTHIVRHIAHDGTCSYFRATHFDPLGFLEFRECLLQNRTEHATTFHGYACDESGDRIGRNCSVSGAVEFNERIPFYALVQGGVLPPQYLEPSSLILDRNVVAFLKQGEDSKHPEAAGVRWTRTFLDQPSFTFSPAISAFEGQDKRTPTYEEFEEEIHQVASLIAAKLPRARVASMSRAVVRQLFEWRLTLDERIARETEFLIEVCPDLAARVPDSRLLEVESRIRRAAAEHESSDSLVLALALATLYESPDGADWAVARKVMKPREHYDAKCAYNCLADLFQLVFAAGATRALSEAAAVLTADRALSLLWCGLGFDQAEPTAEGMRFSLHPTPELFPRLPTERFERFLQPS